MSLTRFYTRYEYELDYFSWIFWARGNKKLRSFIFYYCFTKVPWTSSLKDKFTISDCQKPQLNLISLNFICQQGCFLLKILGIIHFLPLPATKSYLHCLTYGLFLCLQRQKHTVFVSFTDSPLTFTIFPDSDPSALLLQAYLWLHWSHSINQNNFYIAQF